MSLDHEQDTVLESDKPGPGMWWFPTNREHCCIYRVPHRLRRVNPEAYTPQLLLLGPLHHSLKFQALDSRKDITDTKLMGYLNMEEHKKIYHADFSVRYGGGIIDDFRKIIKEDEDMIRRSYLESTAWIESPKFVDMILHDSVFILEFLLRSRDYRRRLLGNKLTWDPIFEQPCLQTTVDEDLILLENQLPYFILEKLFDRIIQNRRLDETLRNVVLTYFGFQGKISENSRFNHFTDLFRCVRVESRGYTQRLERVNNFKKPEDPIKPQIIKHMYNAATLYSAGVKFLAVKDECSIDVRFENGCLKIPCLRVPDDVEITLRNIMALEQCHYPRKAYVCNFVNFLDLLIDTDKDVDLLMEKGILNNWGEKSSVALAEMVNTLFSGIVQMEKGSYYGEIASKVNAYYESPVNRSCAVLGRQYFGNLWSGTATVAATFLLVMTLIQTVASIIQLIQK